MKKLILVLLCFMLTGCLEQKYIERIGMITAVGYDLGNQNKIKGTTVAFQFDPTRQNVSQMLTSEANTSKGIREAMNRETSHHLVSGQLRVSLYGEELARRGIYTFVDTLARDASVGTMSYLAVASPEAASILSAENLSITTNVGTYLYRLLEQNIKSEQTISSTLHEFLKTYYEVGMDPILPMISLMNEKKVTIEGMALFNEDKMVGVLTPEESFYLKLIREHFKSGSIEMELPREVMKEAIVEKKGDESVFITIDNIKSTSDISVKNKKSPDFNVDIKMEARLLEVSEELVSDQQITTRVLEKAIKHTIKSETKKLIEILKEKESDPAGFGITYKSTFDKSDLSNEQWRSLYQKMNLTTAITVSVISIGVMD
ncbi:Ger(x)C family spore germination protein [Metabacillus hrfriensis]|uniref:Ger(X)C family spore germination protein n=1 Tax=Metabacillus hrfriensis TaxID=3048891 RepID=A0ACD4RG90_9BACI|nr:Ger(x)C family spore germination protein [Metabacillus sp. CT-WN-B3]WHZ59501.1 Ger(x)C family spore germination protein [Metabacillus sp. CT-WN-B3]